MNKLPLIILIIPFFIIFTCKSVSADYQSTYQSYISLTDLYRKNYQSYISSKNKYLTYLTLTSQNEAIENGRNFLKARDQLLLQYIKLLNDRTAEAGGFTESDRNLIFSKLNVESVWLTDHRTKYDTALTLQDLQRVSDQTQDRYNTVIKFVALQTAGTILSNKEMVLTNTIEDILSRVDFIIKQMGHEGLDVTLIQRWLLEANNKVSLSKEKQNDANYIFVNLHGQNLIAEYNKAVYYLTESNQYLKEASSYIGEIVRIIKGG